MRSLEPQRPVFAGLFPDAICDYLTVRDRPASSDLIFVLGGRLERKLYGLKLFKEGLAPRLILSVGRFEVRKTEQLGFEDLQLRGLSARMPPAERHFFIELSHNVRRVIPARVQRTGTYGELCALTALVGDPVIQSLILVSTSVHLRRVRLCCRRMNALRQRQIRYVPVPEELSSFRCEAWWTRPDHWSYVAAEYAKLTAYFVVYRDDQGCCGRN